MTVWRVLQALKLGIIAAYFIDYHTDGDFDLPHLRIRAEKGSRLYRLLNWLKETKQ